MAAMALIKGQLWMDHINPNLPPAEYEHEANRQVTHPLCNMEKSSRSMEEQSISTGKTVVELLGTEADGIEPPS